MAILDSSACLFIDHGLKVDSLPPPPPWVFLVPLTFSWYENVHKLSVERGKIDI